MKLGRLSTPLISLVLGAHLASCSPASFCPSGSDVCFQWAVPEVAANSGSGDVYFQIKAPTSYQWVGLGIGGQMAGASMFVVYEDGKGNVTLSTRSGKGHTMPRHVDQENVLLIDGSGVHDGQLIANIRCKDCDGLDLSASNNWIMATKKGDSLDSRDPDEPIQQHDSHSSFNVDFNNAIVASSTNPFLGSSGNKTGNDDGKSLSPHSQGVVEVDDGSNTNIILAHGIIMTVVFLAMYPLGSMLMPLFGKWYIHAGWQMTALALMWAGFGVGYVVSYRLGIFFDQLHTRFGVLIVALMTIQPVLGVLHHLQYRRIARRGLLGHLHTWYGRSIMILGMVNGGLGLKLSGGSHGYIVGYSVAAGISALLYCLSIMFGLFKSKRKTQRAGRPEKL